jgi:CheY-like chemotaxis protein
MTLILHVGKRCNAFKISFPTNFHVEEIDTNACTSTYAIAELVNRNYLKFKQKYPALLIFIPLNVEPCQKNTTLVRHLEVLIEIRINSYYLHKEKTIDSQIDTSRVVVYSPHSMELLFRTYPNFGTVTTPGTFFLQTDHQGVWDFQMAKDFNETALPTKEHIITGFKGQLLRELDPHLHDQRHGNANIFGAHIMLNILQQLQGRPLQFREDLLPLSLRQALYVYNRRLDKVELGDSRKKALNEINLLNKQLTENKYKIGLLDDEGQHFRLEKSSRNHTSFGWTNVFDQILTGATNPGNTGMVDLLTLNEGKPNSVRNLLKKFQLGQKGDSQKTNKHIIKELALRVIHGIRETRCCCLLLDINLKAQKEDGNILGCSGAQLLVELRRIMPAFPIIVVTAVNKPWKHRHLMEIGADAVWVKEGIDEKQLPEDSVRNIIRLFELVRKMTGPEYQFLSRVGLQINRLKKSPNLWWKKPYSFQHCDPKRSLKNFRLHDPACILRILNGSLLEIRRFLLDLHLNRYVDQGSQPSQSILDQEDYFVKSVIRDLSQIIEAIHGKKFDPGYQLNSQDIGGRVQNQAQLSFGRGDWFGFGLYQHRNECSHYFPEIIYSFGDDEKDSRSLMYFMSHLLAYLSTEEEPYCSFESEDLLQTKAPHKSIIRSGYMDWLIHGKSLNLGLEKYQDCKRKLDQHRSLYHLIRTGR